MYKDSIAEKQERKKMTFITDEPDNSHWEEKRECDRIGSEREETLMITVKNLVKRYKDVLALDHFSMQVEDGEHYLMTKTEIENKIATFTGGRVAEEIVFKDITTGASNDIEQATKLARAMVSRFGMADEFGMVAMENVTNQYLGGDTTLSCSNETQTKIDQLVVDIVNKQYEKATQLIKDNLDKLHEIAEYLYKNETITGEEFMQILYKKKEAVDNSDEPTVYTE